MTHAGRRLRAAANAWFKDPPYEGKVTHTSFCFMRYICWYVSELEVDKGPDRE